MEQLKRLIDPLSRRMRAMIMRATVTAVDDDEDLQLLQVSRLEGETIDDCERIGQYGFSSVPPLGAEAVICQIGGNPDHQVILGVDDQSRPRSLTDGQSVLYDKDGTKVFLTGDGNLLIVAAGIVQIQASTLQILADVEISGNVSIGGTLNGHPP